MSMQPFAHANASTVQEAVEVLDETCRPLAGGTDLVAMMKEGLSAPEKLVNLKTIPGLAQMMTGRNGLRIGATVTLGHIAAHLSMTGLPVLQQAIVQSASPQLRHMATLGGNLAQRPRCWYYRNPLTECWRKGGPMCYAFRGENREHVILGGGPCYAVHPSDPAVALLALDAVVTVVGPGTTRSVPLGEFYRAPSRQDRLGMALAPNELITEITIPSPAPGSRGTYVKVARRRRGAAGASGPGRGGDHPVARARGGTSAGGPAAHRGGDRLCGAGRHRGGQAPGAERLQGGPDSGRGAPGAAGGGGAIDTTAPPRVDGGHGTLVVR
jgi:xanthine dehydrogenase YagS FAD-binding subunit